MKYLPIILLLLASCKTVKYIDRVKTVVDSTVIEQNEVLQQTLHETIERYEKVLEESSKTGIVFDTTYIPGDTVTRVIFDNGKIKEVQGRIRSISQDLSEKSSELLDAHSTIDSLKTQLESKDNRVIKETITVTKNIKRNSFSAWLLLIAALVGLVLGLVLEYKTKSATTVLQFVSRIFKPQK